MKLSRIAVLFAAAGVLCLAALASDTKRPAGKAPDSKLPPMDQATRMNLIRGLNAEFVFVRREFPMGQQGLSIKNGQVSPDEAHVQQISMMNGPALKPGDRAQITDIRFKGNKIIFEINGGPKKKGHWYDHVTIGLGAGEVATPQDPRVNPRGTYAELVFDQYIPQVSPDQIKKMLAPVLDFSSLSAAEAYMHTVPPKVRDAIKNHQVLVGMDRDMVTYSMGRPPRKIRESKDGVDYEEWVYGVPPQQVEFVRFVGDEVVRDEIMKVGGERLVRTTKEIDLKKPTPAIAENGAPSEPGAKKSKAPSLLRPGEEVGQVGAGGTVTPAEDGRLPGSPAPPIQGRPAGAGRTGVSAPPMGPAEVPGQPYPAGQPGNPGNPSPTPYPPPGGQQQQPPCCSLGR